jgi:hypothetical protein
MPKLLFKNNNLQTTVLAQLWVVVSYLFHGLISGTMYHMPCL